MYLEKCHFNAIKKMSDQVCHNLSAFILCTHDQSNNSPAGYLQYILVEKCNDWVIDWKIGQHIVTFKSTNSR